MRGLFRRRWLPVAWVDALAKRLVEFLLSLGGAVVLLLAIDAVTAGPSAGGTRGMTTASEGKLWALIAVAFFLVRATYRLIVHPIRAAITGRFVHEEAMAGVPEYRGMPSTSGETSLRPSSRE
jgi:hypothetical protein